MTLIKNISGFRGTIGGNNLENLTPADIVTSISAFSIFIFLSISIFWYHILTGIRHLIMDFFHIGESLNGSYYSSIFTIVLWIATSLVFFGYLFI